jgi:AbrB family looped-hinge helix DNA binding protein
MKARSARSQISSKGQLVIPQELREELGLERGDEVMLTLLPGGSLKLTPLKRSIDRIFGALHVPDDPPVDVDEAVMEAMREDEERLRRKGL